MKFSCVFVAVFLFVLGAFSAYAQDLIILKDGSTIEAKVMEISPAEIKYKRFDHLDGPMIVIPAHTVQRIAYENGRIDIIDVDPPSATNLDLQASIPLRKPILAPMNPDKFTFGIAADPSGFLLSGPQITADFTKGNAYTQVNMRLPFLGMISGKDSSKFGIAATFNYIWHFKYGSLYLGGMGEMAFGTHYIENYYVDALGKGVDEGRSESGLDYLGFAVNVGYKLVFSWGMYLRAGTYLGVDIPMLDEVGFLFRPGLTIGYDF